MLGLGMSEEALVNHTFVRLEPQVQDHEEVEDKKIDERNLSIDISETKFNVVANVSDKNPVESIIGEKVTCAIIKDLVLSSRKQLIEEQRKNPELGHIYRYLENPEDSSVNATIRERAGLVIFEKVIADNLFDNYISRYGAPIKMINDNGPQFISDNFEHLSNRLGIRHVKTVVCRPQVNRTERVNCDLAQMIANYVNDYHETWD
ncbi:retrovirus-related Pol polyprotein from transposon 17.6 [Trichonephila clavipes]|nr:retrovirus-related Pol polyprotein from transposon 17.6 [Trichonephila clavipes]